MKTIGFYSVIGMSFDKRELCHFPLALGAALALALPELLPPFAPLLGPLAGTDDDASPPGFRNPVDESKDATKSRSCWSVGLR